MKRCDDALTKGSRQTAPDPVIHFPSGWILYTKWGSFYYPVLFGVLTEQVTHFIFVFRLNT